MKKTVLVLMVGLLLVGVNVFAAGDLIVDGKAGIGTTSPGATLDVRGSAIFNEDGADADFRVEGVGQPWNFFIDASTGTTWIDLASGSDITANNFPLLKLKAKFKPAALAVHGYEIITASINLKNSTAYSAGSNFNALNFLLAVEDTGSVGSANLNLNFINVMDILYSGDTTFGNVYGLKHQHSQSKVFGVPTLTATNWYTLYSATPTISEGTMTLTNRYGTYIADYAGATITNQYGHYIEKQTAGANNYGIVLAGDGLGADLVMGANKGTKLYGSSGNFIVDTTGKVGIGTTNPQSKLAVAGLPTTKPAGSTTQGMVCITTAGDMWIDTTPSTPCN